MQMDDLDDCQKPYGTLIGEEDAPTKWSGRFSAPQCQYLYLLPLYLLGGLGGVGVC